MPELPEVETTRRGIAPHLEGQRIERIVIRRPALRWPIPPALLTTLPGQTIHLVARRAKYLLLHTDAGTLLLHLGMSGHLRLLPAGTPVLTHDHFDIITVNGQCLRLNDPRRFGAVLWAEPGQTHPLLATLGPEPLSEQFNADTLKACAKGRKTSIKALIMDNHMVVGVGNIYANEALFLSGIHPAQASGKVSGPNLERLAENIKQVLTEAIRQGGTTLRDFLASDGKPGYFQQQLSVYGRAGQPCLVCSSEIQQIRQGQRSSFFCPHCQK